MTKQKPFWETGLNPITMTRETQHYKEGCTETPQMRIDRFRKRWHKNNRIDEHTS